MGEPPIPHMHPLPLQSPSLPKSNLHMLYYGLFVIGTAATVLVLYNLIIVKWCTEYSDNTRLGRTSNLERRLKKPKKLSLSSFKYKKDRLGEEDDDSECAVCLSVFEEGEEIRQLPQCKHCFHAPCIDMWLYSHLACPLCSSPVLLRCSYVTNLSGSIPTSTVLFVVPRFFSGVLMSPTNQRTLGKDC
ncbi:unnamed protein product [Fraxinus pennsylvanica]|uniref:RING-type domain-containing protein n=1 Tax=Fraxinus pennsylvanica TaxID=56036 RepID=A0AAD2ECD7_9LAMI|nr:unnamed protein product [Fraxinus pennsylvanica]